MLKSKILQRFPLFSMLKSKILQRFSSFSMLKANIFLIKNSPSMSKGFLDHNLFHDPNVTTIHRDYPDNRGKDVRNSILWPSLFLGIMLWVASLPYKRAKFERESTL